jgi:hypothetical protein
VAQLPRSLAPSPGERGRATDDRQGLADSVRTAWDLFVELAEPLDLEAPTRARGLTVREVLTPLGAWPDNRPLPQLLDEARRGVVGDHDQGALVEQVRESHRDATREAVIGALRRQRDDMVAFLGSPEADDDGLRPVASMLGTIPVLTFLHASTYPLSTSALDLEQAGAVVPDELLDLGLVGVLDTIGALAARQGLMTSLTVRTPGLVAGVGAMPRDWRTARLPEGAEPEGPRIDGSVRLLLDVTAGRADVARALAAQELSFHDVPGLLALAPLIEQVPGIPGRAALVAGIRAVQGVSSLLRMFGLRR